MLLRPLKENDRQAWLDLAHESDEIIRQLIPDIAIFYQGFDDYIEAKIKQNEAFMAMDRMSGRCLGIVAISKSHNRISFLGVTKNADFWEIGSKLVKIALNQLDSTREISVNVLKTDLEPIKQERFLYESLGFTERDGNVSEAGVPACLMKRPPAAGKGGYSFHHDYPGYIQWMDEGKCPFCHKEQVWTDHMLIKELEHSSVHASMQAQGCLWGKCVVPCRKHFIEFHEIPPRDMADFMEDVQKAAKALKEVSGAVKINYELHGNTIPHLHVHLFPRYLDDLFPGKAIDYAKITPSPYENEAEFEYFITQMRLKLSD